MPNLIALSSPHVHTQFCDAKSTAEEMVLAALGLGFVSLGFSSHAVQDFDSPYALSMQGEQDYIQEICRLQAAYRDRIRIWLGMERDLLSIADRSPFDYVLGSVHYLEDAQGERIAVDGPPEKIRRRIDQDYAGDGLAFAETYFSLLGSYIRDYKPDIIGHFDLLTKHNRSQHFFDTGHPRYRKAAFTAMEKAIKGCTLLEVNTGAIARSGASLPYPSLDLLQHWRSLGGQVILSSDCHRAWQLNAGYDIGVAHILQAGFKKAAILGRHDTLFEWVELIDLP